MTATASKFEGFIALAFPEKGMSDEAFFEFCQLNRELKIERNSTGEIIIMSPTGTKTGGWNSEFNIELGIWNRTYKFGKTFDSSTGFKLPNGATYGPDAAWVLHEKWNALSPHEQEGFAPIVPDFVAEIRSKSDTLKSIQEKIAEFMACGCRLAWLIDPILQITTVYQADGNAVETPFDQALSGGNVLPGFEVVLADLFQ